MSEEEIKKEEPKKPECRLCGQPCGPIRCNNCGGYQTWPRKYWPLASTLGMLTPLVALLGAIVTFTPFAITQCTNYLHRHSQTSVGFAGVGENVVYAHVWNSGRSPSSVRKYTLRLKELDLEDVPLIPIREATHEVRSVIPADGDVTVALLVLGLAPKPLKTSADVLAALNEQKKVTIEAEVIESNNPTPVMRSETFDAGAIRGLVQSKLPPEKGADDVH